MSHIDHLFTTNYILWCRMFIAARFKINPEFVNFYDTFNDFASIPNDRRAAAPVICRM